MKNWPRYAKVLDARRKGRTFASIGRELGVSYNRVIQMEEEALLHLFRSKGVHMPEMLPPTDYDVSRYRKLRPHDLMFDADPPKPKA